MPDNTALPSTPMSIQEMLRIMDVASEFRQQRDRADREFRVDEQRDALRDKLMQAAAVTGEELTVEQLDAAIDWYYEHLHSFKMPPFGLSMFMAHAYIRRHYAYWLIAAVAVFFFVKWWT